MINYRYVVKTKEGEEVRGSVAAPTFQSALKMVMNLFTSIEELSLTKR